MSSGLYCCTLWGTIITSTMTLVKLIYSILDKLATEYDKIFQLHRRCFVRVTGTDVSWPSAWQCHGISANSDVVTSTELTDWAVRTLSWDTVILLRASSSAPKVLRLFRCSSSVSQLYTSLYRLSLTQPVQYHLLIHSEQHSTDYPPLHPTPTASSMTLRQ